MKNKWNVLIFPGGTENGLEIYLSLKNCKEIDLYSASSNIENQAFYVFDNNNIVRDVREKGWVDELNEIINEKKIDIIFPSNAFVIDSLNKEKDKILCEILIPSNNVLHITRSKINTINLLDGVIPTPKIYKDPEKITNFPIFIKPDKGYGSQGATKIKHNLELNNFDLDLFIMQEYLPGKEYTIDCFSDSDGNLLFSSGRERSRIRMGTSMHAEKIPDNLDQQFKEYAIKILKKIKIVNAWFFQLKEDSSNNLKLLEIDVRISGTMCYNRSRGINFPLLSLYQHYNLPISILVNSSQLKLDRCLKNRYIFDYNYDKVYVDLDDTIIIKKKINLEMIFFLYQCVNKRIRIILLTKNLSNDISSYLSKYRIKEVFDEIIVLDENDKKSFYIESNKAIFIDDSFSQRIEVSKKCKIPTFDCSMIESLIDERI